MADVDTMERVIDDKVVCVASKDNFLVIHHNTTKDENHAKTSLGNFPTKNEALDVAKEDSGDNLKTYVYDDQGLLIKEYGVYSV